MTVHVARHAIDAIVLDIEGTTTPIAFVYGVLFPFARRHLHGHLLQHRDGDELRSIILRLRQEWAVDFARGESPPPWPEGSDSELSSVEGYVEWLMDRDRKSSPLKLLQGRIWERGYHSGELRSEVFPDVAPAIERWRAIGLQVAIYSSGSVLAQRLLFGHTPEGDLTPYLTGLFDTAVGAKTSSDSYRQIAAALQCATDRMLFVSDTLRELDAARGAGCRVLLSVRPGNVHEPHGQVEVIGSLDEIIVS